MCVGAPSILIRASCRISASADFEQWIPWVYIVVVDIIIVIIIIFPMTVLLLLMHCSLFKFTLAMNSVLLLWKGLDFLLGTSETLLCLMSAPPITIFSLLDALQMLSCLQGR
jgi:hypothetical protein